VTTTAAVVLVTGFFFAYVLGKIHTLLEAIEENTREKK
jgi:hypothetical protein